MTSMDTPFEAQPRTCFVPVTIAGHYLLTPPAQPSSSSPLIIAFHGYGEDAGLQMERLRMLEMARSSWLCAPQALHPFYPGRGRRVGACWMTRWQRELAIEQNLDYIGKVLAAVRAQAGLPGGPLFLAGFSQGVGMVYRMACVKRLRGVAGALCLGGDIPPELTTPQLRALPPLLLARGRLDKIYNQQAFDADQERLAQAGLSSCATLFEGAHEWNGAFVASANAFVTTCLAAEK